MSLSYPNLPNTKFPENIDNFDRFLDIDNGDFEKIKAYQDAIESADMATAMQILETIPQYEKKLISSLKLNELRDAILAIETFYRNDVESYVENKQILWKDIVDQFSYKGQWGGSVYKYNNIVLYDGDLYLNIYQGNTPSNVIPTNKIYWRKLTIEGKQGTASDKCTFDFAWSEDKYYQSNTIVTHSNIWWLCIQPNKAHEPFVGSNDWNLILKPTQLVYPITNIEPQNQENGELWFKILNRE